MRAAAFEGIADPRHWIFKSRDSQCLLSSKAAAQDAKCHALLGSRVLPRFTLLVLGDHRLGKRQILSCHNILEVSRVDVTVPSPVFSEVRSPVRRVVAHL